MSIKILIVDDEPLILKGLRYSLEQDDYIVDEALDGRQALNMATENLYDIILLDVMLPEMSGIDVLREVRQFSEVPIIMLTAKGEDMDKILGLEYGADDYMVKPFNILEVKARIRSVLRRSMRKDTDSVHRQRDIEVDPSSRRVTRAGEEIHLTAREFDLLYLLVTNPDHVYSREELLANLLNNTTAEEEMDYNLRTVDVHVRRLREKLEVDPANPEYIKTKWGVGYYFSTR